MKNLVFFLLIAKNAVSQIVLPIDTTTGRIAFTDIEVVDSTSKSDLYTRAKMFCIEKFTNSKNVIQMDDKESGIIIGKYTFTHYITMLGSLQENGQIETTIKIFLKDNKYKCVLTDYIFKYPGFSDHPMETQYPGSTDRRWNYSKQQVKGNATEMLRQLNQAMTKKSQSTNNW
ncbi:MAG: DUF4468 domain-containing protein [Bacteroidota bacterium]